MKTLLLTLLAAALCGCMSPKQRAWLHTKDIAARYAQARTYQPVSITALDGITFDAKGATSITLNVPLEQLASTPIPDDCKTVTDFLKWAGGMGLIGYGLHQAAQPGTTTNITNNNAPAAQ
jgi:hypothetical protein